MGRRVKRTKEAREKADDKSPDVGAGLKICVAGKREESEVQVLRAGGSVTLLLLH